MRVLVTGGAGFIGSHVVDGLINRGDEVVCIDNFNDYYNPKFKEDNIKTHLKNEKFTLIRGNILDAEVLKKIFDEGVDAVVHLAARAGVRPSIADPKLYEKVNIFGTINILEFVRKYGIKKFIFASSSSVYGNNKKVPFSEEDNVDYPISPYAATKKAGELICYTYHHLHKINIFCLRFFTVYGPRGRPDMAPYIFTKNMLEGKPINVFGDGDSERDYTFIKDIVNGIICALDKCEGFQIINLGNSSTVKLNKLIETIESATAPAIRLNVGEQPGDVKRTFADITKATKILGYKPQTSITEGINVFVEWYKKNRL